jgi:nitroimidazol reductase NimA-like FMN-containing flavoprotein (pyridoxamine 5'-phosphate oxidase superfamily)
VTFFSTAVQSVLEQGSFCHVATAAPSGPHCTPLVFAYSGGRLWLTTSRRSVKTRSWKADPSAAGLV